MPTSRRLKRWIALVLLAALAFAQATIAGSACAMDRRTLSQAVASMDGDAGGCAHESMGQAPLSTNRCLMHCTADLQISGLPIAIVRSVVDAPVLLVPQEGLSAPFRVRPDAPPPVAVPIRILLHSFLI